LKLKTRFGFFYLFDYFGVGSRDFYAFGVIFPLKIVVVFSGVDIFGGLLLQMPPCDRTLSFAISVYGLIVLFAFIEFREGRDFHSGWLHL
jgi:prepilin signal peptidase PulO-like enzyme (type II secretory pathway)